MKDSNKNSRFLSLVLRHQPEKIGIVLSPSGWTDVGILLQQMDMSMAELEDIVATNNKKRFEFNEGKTRIRACQGHSVRDVDLGLTPVYPPKFLYHGTSAKVRTLIDNQGIKKMSRNHVHLSADQETAYAVGKRHGKDVVVLKICAQEMWENHYKFYRSANGVWLTDYVPSKYIIDRS